MGAWVDDIVQALKNLGGQATVKQIYAEVERIRVEPLTKSWHASVRERIEAHSSDSNYFQGKDLFRKIDRGVWALRDSAQTKRHSPSQIASSLSVRNIQPSKPSSKSQKPVIRNYLPSESLEEISNTLRTIKQYRDYTSPDSPDWEEYVKEIFHNLQFSTKELDPRLFTLNVMGTNQSPKAIAVYILPEENFEEMVPGLPWQTHLFLAAQYHQVEWGILTNGLQLKVLNFKDREPRQLHYWPNLDEIIRDEKIDTFCTIYKVFAFIKGDHGLSVVKQGEKGLSRRHVLRREFWIQLLQKAKEKTIIHANISPSKENWVSASAGKTGLYFNYVVCMGDARVEFYIDRGDTEWNKRVYNTFFRHKDEIENRFGDRLEWRLLPDKRASQIRYMITDYGLKNADRWDELQDLLIDAMIRLESACRPIIQKID